MDRAARDWIWSHRRWFGVVAALCAGGGLLVATASADGFRRGGKRSTLPPLADVRPAPATAESGRTSRRPQPAAATAPAVAASPPTALSALFRRPPPPPAADPLLVDLGATLFHDRRLSGDHRLSCATCHVPARGFVDGRRTARGKGGRGLTRNTPALWDLAFANRFYWDGRAPTLEAQIVDAIERESEMDGTVAAGVLWLSRDPAMVDAFARARQPLQTDTVVGALVAYQRSLASAETRFDRWVAGEATALSPQEVQGFQVFTGPGRCLACHGGWRFTDERLHDIGLPGRDRRRLAPAGTSEASPAERAFKTPSLREVRWTAPYMHDGRLGSLTAVVDHYASPRRRPAGVAAELREPIRLSTTERAALVAFLQAISSDRPPAVPGGR